MARSTSASSQAGRKSRFRRRLLLFGGLLAAVWVGFVDSHSVYRRWQLHRETDRLTAENEQLRETVARLEAELERGLTDEEIERIAREQYGMRREGETVYPLKK